MTALPELLAWHSYPRETHRSIVETGYFLSLRERKRLGIFDTPVMIESVDVSVGDDKYVFFGLSIVNGNCNYPISHLEGCYVNSGRYVAGFDAARLLRRKGAMLGETDLYDLYRDLNAEFRWDRLKFLHRAHQMQRKYRRKYPESLAYARELAKDCADIVASGSSTVRCGAFRDAEILVPTKVPLSWAKYYIYKERGDKPQIVDARDFLAERPL